MKTVILIPARQGATRFPNKPLAEIDGIPMINRVVQQAELATIGPVHVACCGDEIKRVVEECGGKAHLTDPDLPSGSDRIWAAYNALDEAFDLIINLQGDLPAVNPIHLKRLQQDMEKNPHIEIGTLAAPFQNVEKCQDPDVVKVAFSPIENKMCPAHYFSRAPIPHNAHTFYHHIGIYAYRPKALQQFVAATPTYLEQTEKLEQLRAIDLGLKIGVSVVDEVPLSVDKPDDIQKVLAHLNRK